MCGLMLRLNLVHKHLEGEEQRTFPDYCVGSDKALRPLGAPGLKGLKKRPAFLMGDETVDTIRRTVQEANDGKADKTRFGFETECRHSSEGRESGEMDDRGTTFPIKGKRRTAEEGALRERTDTRGRQETGHRGGTRRATDTSRRNAVVVDGPETPSTSAATTITLWGMKMDKYREYGTFAASTSLLHVQSA